MPEDNPARRIEAAEGMTLRLALVRALKETDGDVSAVARRFGVSRQTMHDWIKREGINIERQAIVT